LCVVFRQKKRQEPSTKGQEAWSKGREKSQEGAKKELNREGVKRDA
jgi:hypothetical protein